MRCHQLNLDYIKLDYMRGAQIQVETQIGEELENLRVSFVVPVR